MPNAGDIIVSFHLATISLILQLDPYGGTLVCLIQSAAGSSLPSNTIHLVLGVLECLAKEDVKWYHVQVLGIH